ncbi:DUF2110 family protein [Halorutilales archaeon Cl-col2-1]
MKKVLNSKIYVEGDARGRALDGAEAVIRDRLEGLDVEYEVRLREDDRIEVEGIGEDIEMALSLLADEFGEFETDPEKGETYVGTLESWDEDGFTVDIGREVLVPAESLDALGAGTPSQIRERYGLVQHTPLEVVWEDTPHLSDDQADELWDWQKGNGRINVNSSTRGEVRATVNRAGHAQDIVTVERLGFLEQSIICKQDTDPPGLLAEIGKYIQGEMKCVVASS